MVTYLLAVALGAVMALALSTGLEVRAPERPPGHDWSNVYEEAGLCALAGGEPVVYYNGAHRCDPPATTTTAP